jgi:hypothetical protein
VSIICVYYDSQSTIENEQSNMYNGKDIYIIEIIPLNTFSQMELFPLTI